MFCGVIFTIWSNWEIIAIKRPEIKYSWQLIALKATQNSNPAIDICKIGNTNKKTIFLFESFNKLTPNKKSFSKTENLLLPNGILL